ncbi:MAG: MFS transporter [Bacteroidia bacterium]|nr:MFS transporter [Bacteroidia bacterium]
MNQPQRINSGFIAIITVFFFWGFVAASNGILIPLFKVKFELSQFQSQLVDFTFYLAYFIGSIVYFVLSEAFGDPLNKLGYKKGLVFGLLLSAIGALLFIPAANMNSYILLLMALFVIGLGFALQQIVANRFVANYGDKAHGAHRLSLAGGINSFGTTIGPVLLGFALFGSAEAPKPESIGIESVKTPALILFGLFILCAMLIQLSKLPKVSSEETSTKDFKLSNHPQLIYGMIAIFLYVGVEVSIQSNLGALLELPEIKGIDHTLVAPYISLYWGSLMIGRWTGAVTVFKVGKIGMIALQIIVPLLAFSIVFLVNTLYNNDTSDFISYLPFVLLAIGLFIIAGEDAAKTLFILGSVATVLMLVGLFTNGTLALLAFTSGGLFCSVMWPCIFSLSIGGLGKYTNQGSSLLIMMILGGAIVPPLQGYLSDSIGIHNSYFVTVICFAYLAWFGFKMRRNKAIQEDVSVDAGLLRH